MTTPDLAAICTRTAELAGSALDWITDRENADIVGSQVPSLTRELRRAASRARKLATAAERNMCVGVFGPSQAGKSFLVSVLARPQNGNLAADFDAPLGRKDFISEINPPGEGESTGLVTRFTMRREPCPSGYPVRLRLLSEADLVRVLANTFLMDGDQTEEPPTPEEINGLLETYSKKKGAGVGMSAEEVWDIREYFEKGFSRSAYVAALKPFWEEAADIAPGLAPIDRARFLSILWGRHDLFTDVYTTLSAALARIGHAGEVFAAPEALLPRDASIIDVKTLAGLDGGGIQTEVALRTASGITAKLTKPIMTALTAELVITMAEQPWDMFSRTDLLDFPGARARFTNNLAKTFATAETPRKDTFLRGKVAYLFDRYVAEQELTSMLLCIPPSNMEVTDLPGLVEDWVTATHGATPGERAQTECILFFVFTKFDMHLADNAATGTDPVTRYERRIAASMTDPFGKLSDSWVNDWAHGRAFDNSYWLRNPNYPAEAFIRYDANLRETGFVAEKEARLAELRAGCLSVPAVRKHFADPARAWDAAMSLNDGGVSYLVERLTPVCRPEIKARQIGAQLAIVCRHIQSKLQPFYVSDEIETRLEEKRAAAADVLAALSHAGELSKFGEVLEALMVDADAIADRILRVPDSVRIVAGSGPRTPSMSDPTPSASGGARPVLPGSGTGPRPVVPGGGVAAARPVLPGGIRVAAPATAAGAPPSSSHGGGNAPVVRSLTREAFQAEMAMLTWVETMHDFAARPDLYAHFGISPEVADNLVSELVAAARRFGVQRKLTEELAKLNFFLRAEGLSGPVATIAGDRICRFVARLGVDDLPPARRPRVQYEDGSEKPVFQPRPLRFSAEDLPEQELNEAAVYLTDWLFALYQLYEDNARSTEGASINVEQNSRLGGILRSIEGIKV
ncbi:virulence factor SrfC family protein [Azospirillum halopraeferens]|uniref:virulence factor SrfC family protein n=1 Tax=Azospirillum halopraeferens TaxID=34010 RepID=UPI0004089DB5|nr:virulence factor SrfC family protein [Azospirillum halopraeferens]